MAEQDNEAPEETPTPYPIRIDWSREGASQYVNFANVGHAGDHMFELVFSEISRREERLKGEGDDRYIPAIPRASLRMTAPNVLALIQALMGAWDHYVNQYDIPGVVRFTDAKVEATSVSEESVGEDSEGGSNA